jgi:hypothetical protein
MKRGTTARRVKEAIRAREADLTAAQFAADQQLQKLGYRKMGGKWAKKIKDPSDPSFWVLAYMKMDIANNVFAHGMQPWGNPSKPYGSSGSGKLYFSPEKAASSAKSEIQRYAKWHEQDAKQMKKQYKGKIPRWAK